MDIKNITIIGLGALGGSLGLALKSYNPDFVITGIDKGSVIIKAKDLQAVDNGCLYNELEDGIRDADLIILATSLRGIKELIPKISHFIKDDAIVTDTGMVKGEIVDIAKSSFKDKGNYIGGHPVVGFKRGGVEYSDPYLFSGITYALTPIVSSRSAVDTMVRIVDGIGSKSIVLEPEVHDKLVGEINNILQVITIAHINSVFSELDDNLLEAAVLLSGERFKKFSESLFIEPYYWDEVFKENLKVIRDYTNRFVDYLKKTVQNLEKDSFYEDYEKARELVSKIPYFKKGFQSKLSCLYVNIEDKPGSIAELTSLIAKHGFDIRDIEVVKIKEGESVLIKVAFKSQSIASKVGMVLMEAGYSYTTYQSYEVDGIM